MQYYLMKIKENNMINLVMLRFQEMDLQVADLTSVDLTFQIFLETYLVIVDLISLVVGALEHVQLKEEIV